MKFGRVVGTVVCTQKDTHLNGVKLLVVQPLTEHLEEKGDLYVAADAIGQAGYGDIVSVVFSADATQAFPSGFIPVDASIIGFPDGTTIASQKKREETEEA